MVLLVEDEVLIRMDIADSLRGRGFDVVEVGTAVDALNVLRAGAFDIVLTDVHMPGGVTGIELARYIKHNLPGVVVIVMSGRYRPHEEEAELFDAFVTKPFSDIATVLREVSNEGEV